MFYNLYLVLYRKLFVISCLLGSFFACFLSVFLLIYSHFLIHCNVCSNKLKQRKESIFNVNLKLSLLCMVQGDEYVQIVFYVEITNSSIL